MKLTVAQIERMAEKTLGYSRTAEAELTDVPMHRQGPITILVYNVYYVIWPSGATHAYARGGQYIDNDPALSPYLTPEEQDNVSPI